MSDDAVNVFDDTPPIALNACIKRGSISAMSAVRGRAPRSRRNPVPTVSLQARVSLEVREGIEQAAATSGVSLAYYLESFFRDQLANNGRLPVVEGPRPQQEELNITAA